MKLHGVKITGPNIETIVIPREDESIVFKAQAILDMDEFDKICPMPEPPKKRMKGGEIVPDLEDEAYMQQFARYAEMKAAYTIVKSLDVPGNPEWETVRLTEPATWPNYNKELIDSGFSMKERELILRGVLAANALDESKIEQARKLFIRSQQEKAQAGSSQEGGPASTPPGVLASG